MVAATVPAVYASALLDLATDKGQRAEVVADAAAVSSVFETSPELLNALNSPKLSREQGKELLQKVFGDRATKTLLDFLLLTIDRERAEELPEILAAVVRMAAEQDGREAIVVTSAVELNDENRARLEQSLKARRGQNITITYQVDSSIIGGLRIQAPETVIDFTARRHLAEMKRTMLQAQVDATWAAE